MDKDRIIGAGKQVAGFLKRAVGRLLGDAKMQVDGKVEQLQGRAQNVHGSVKDAVKESGAKS